MNADAMIDVARKQVSAYVQYRRRQILQHRAMGNFKIADLAQQELERFLDGKR